MEPAPTSPLVRMSGAGVRTTGEIASATPTRRPPTRLRVARPSRIRWCQKRLSRLERSGLRRMTSIQTANHRLPQNRPSFLKRRPPPLGPAQPTSPMSTYTITMIFGGGPTSSALAPLGTSGIGHSCGGAAGAAHAGTPTGGIPHGREIPINRALGTLGAEAVEPTRTILSSKARQPTATVRSYGRITNS